MKLGVNIDHIATLRNARGQDNPNLIRALKVCQEAKIDTLTVHLREDRRHIKDKDLFELKKYSAINADDIEIREIINKSVVQLRIII